MPNFRILVFRDILLESSNLPISETTALCAPQMLQLLLI